MRIRILIVTLSLTTIVSANWLDTLNFGSKKVTCFDKKVVAAVKKQTEKQMKSNLIQVVTIDDIQKRCGRKVDQQVIMTVYANILNGKQKAVIVKDLYAKIKTFDKKFSQYKIKHSSALGLMLESASNIFDKSGKTIKKKNPTRKEIEEASAQDRKKALQDMLKDMTQKEKEYYAEIINAQKEYSIIVNLPKYHIGKPIVNYATVDSIDFFLDQTVYVDKDNYEYYKKLTTVNRFPYDIYKIRTDSKDKSINQVTCHATSYIINIKKTNKEKIELGQINYKAQYEDNGKLYVETFAY